jgi:hypothetical protein
MMCVELRIRCSQPPSRRFFGSLSTLTKRYRRSPEVRHQLATVLRNWTRESRFRCTSTRFLVQYLYGAFMGVTLDQPADCPDRRLESYLKPTSPAVEETSQIDPTRTSMDSVKNPTTAPLTRSQVSTSMPKYVPAAGGRRGDGTHFLEPFE